MVEKKELKVKKTSLSGQGQARLNSGILKDLDVSKDDKVEVSKGEKKVNLKIHASEGIKAEEIRLNVKDMDEIGAMEGDKVSVRKGNT